MISAGLIFCQGHVEVGENEPATFLYSSVYSGLYVSIIQILFLSGLNMSKNAGKLTMLLLLQQFSSYIISIFRFDEMPTFLSLVGMVMMTYGLFKVLFTKP